MVSKQWLVVRNAREFHIKLVGGRLPLGGTALPPTPSPKGTPPKTPVHSKKMAYTSCPLVGVGDYNDGCRFVADFESVIKSDNRPIVQQLADINIFRNFSLQAHTITWPNGVDFAPEFIKGLVNSPFQR